MIYNLNFERYSCLPLLSWNVIAGYAHSGSLSRYAKLGDIKDGATLVKITNDSATFALTDYITDHCIAYSSFPNGVKVGRIGTYDLIINWQTANMYMDASILPSDMRNVIKPVNRPYQVMYKDNSYQATGQWQRISYSSSSSWTSPFPPYASDFNWLNDYLPSGIYWSGDIQTASGGSNTTTGGNGMIYFYTSEVPGTSYDGFTDYSYNNERIGTDTLKLVLLFEV